MAERISWATQNAGPTGILNVEETRVALGIGWARGASGLLARTGFRAGPGSGAVSATGTPDGFVHVSAFQLVLQTVRAGVGGPYLCTLDSVKDINVLSTPADPTNPRDDLIIARQTDTFYADASSAFAVERILGTPAGVPTDPTVTGSQDYVALARVRVGALATTITNANITDLRTGGHAKSLIGGLHTVALGGLLPVASQAQRDALVGTYDGYGVWRQDTGAIEVSNGAGGWLTFVRTPTPSVQAVDATSRDTTSTTFTGVLTPAGLCGIAFVGPASGKVMIHHGVELKNSASNFTACAPIVRTGTTVGAGSTVAPLTGNVDHAVRCDQSTFIAGGKSVLLSGLTPGSNYNVSLEQIVGAGTGTFARRSVSVIPQIA